MVMAGREVNEEEVRLKIQLRLPLFAWIKT